MKKPDEYENFDRNMRKLISVPHSEIKAKLDAERAAKRQKKGKRSNQDDKENKAAR